MPSSGWLSSIRRNLGSDNATTADVVKIQNVGGDGSNVNFKVCNVNNVSNDLHNSHNKRYVDSNIRPDGKKDIPNDVCRVYKRGNDVRTDDRDLIGRRTSPLDGSHDEVTTTAPADRRVNHVTGAVMNQRDKLRREGENSRIPSALWVQPPAGSRGQPPAGSGGQSPAGSGGQPAAGSRGQPPAGSRGQPPAGPQFQDLRDHTSWEATSQDLPMQVWGTVPPPKSLLNRPEQTGTDRHRPELLEDDRSKLYQEDPALSPEGELGETRSTSTSPSPSIFQRPAILPLYTQVARPSPAASGALTPMFENDPKRVRFVEPRMSAPHGPRPCSASSQYSDVVKNSARYHYPSSQTLLETMSHHDPRSCHCPCHFLPSVGRRSVAVQAWPRYFNGRQMAGRTPALRPRHSRLFFWPTLRELRCLTPAAAASAVLLRVLLSQVGVAVVLGLWWWGGALVFSALEAPLEEGVVARVAKLRSQVVIELATDLRKVVPQEATWLAKITEYAEKLEAATLDATRAGYATRAPHWTVSGALLYAACLTCLMGPSGAVVRSDMTRLLSLPYSLVGSSLLLLLSISAAHLLRELLGSLWRCRSRKIRDRNPPSVPVDVSPAPKVPRQDRVHVIKAVGLSRVLALDDMLDEGDDVTGSCRSLDDVTSAVDQRIADPLSWRHEPRRALQTPTSSSRSGYVPTIASRDQKHPNYNGVLNPSVVFDPSLDPNWLPRARVGAPTLVFITLLVVHCGLWVALLSVVFEVPYASSIQRVLSTVLTLDAGSWHVNDLPDVWLCCCFPLFLVTSHVLTMALLLSCWPCVSNFFRYTGKELSVTTPVMLRS
ncbi:uncharacterized protein LOC125178505 [Hyalella azteca]|uniref:Uncharacterized protein LOC125178505 n=1 Tax=Hyalella azteca TaxID=294128 RepID=A0A979FMS0_HYAAZ|nr:uncharacterized protein LOC125178505 [Hyalella azteca]